MPCLRTSLVRASWSLWLLLGCVGSPPAPPPAGTGTTEGSSSSSSTTEMVPASTTSSVPPSDSTGTTAPPECLEGSLGCPCAPECDEGLVCIDGTCQSPSCGDGYPDAREECDDGNDTPSDGCEADCTISPGAAAVALGEQHACALFHTGGVKCWGRSNHGRLGYPGVFESIGDNETPADMDFVDLGGPAAELALGEQFSCARLVDGGVRCWGRGSDGQLGQGSTVDVGLQEPPSSLAPIALGGPAVQLTAGGDHACAVLEDGTLRCWGRNETGQLGYPDQFNVGDDEVPASLPPVDVGGPVAQVTAGGQHTCARLTTDELRCWGANFTGQLGHGHTQIIGDNEAPATAPPLELGEPVTFVDSFDHHSCAIMDSGALRCWGEGGNGQLGVGSTLDIGDNEFPLAVRAVALGGQAVDVAAGDGHTCALLSGGAIFCWGYGYYGQLGYGNNNSSNEPSPEPVEIAPAMVATSIEAGQRFTCLRSAASEIKCWGRNNYGQLGYGPTWSGDLGDNELPSEAGVVPLE